MKEGSTMAANPVDICMNQTMCVFLQGSAGPFQLGHSLTERKPGTFLDSFEKDVYGILWEVCPIPLLMQQLPLLMPCHHAWFEAHHPSHLPTSPPGLPSPEPLVLYPTSSSALSMTSPWPGSSPQSILPFLLSLCCHPFHSQWACIFPAVSQPCA